MKHPLVGEPVSFSGFFRGPVSGHMLGILGGLIWGTGTVFNMVAASLTGVAISYAVGQSAPMVAALWGVFVWKEFAGAGSRAKMYLAGMFVFYCLAILSDRESERLVTANAGKQVRIRARLQARRK